jgi:transcriptional regulator with XRE-family HTH domain
LKGGQKLTNKRNTKSQPYRTIGEVVKELRKIKGIRICSLAQKAKIPYQTLQGHENGHVKVPGFDIVYKLAIALDEPLETFGLERRKIIEKNVV